MMRGDAVTTFRDVPTTLGELITDLQSRGMRAKADIERRVGGAGPTDSGMIWIEGVAVTVPTESAVALTSPYTLECEDASYAIYRDGIRMAGAEGMPRPKFYDL